MKKKFFSKKRITIAVLIVVVALCLLNAAVGLHRSVRPYVYTNEVRRIADVDEQGIGEVEVMTLPLDASYSVRRATYTPTGRVLIAYQRTGENGGYSGIAVLDDDGENLTEIYQGELPKKYRCMVDRDNTRVLLGDAVLECPEGTTLDTCPAHMASTVPVTFPSEFSEDSAVTDPWTEVILSNDGEYIAWTIRRTDCGAANAMGRLVRKADGYEIEDARYISAMQSYTAAGQAGELLPCPIIGGEVKQFVHGGAAISLVGSASCGMADSVIQDIATGEVTCITHNPGYDETTILSPDETKGIVMTSRFSPTSDLGVLGLVERPYGDALHGIMGQLYMYSVTGVRSEREGNIGPAIVDVQRAEAEADYMGVDVSDPTQAWVYCSPMSWNNDSTRAMWIEELREGSGVRVQIAVLRDARPTQPVADVATPAVSDYADATLQVEDSNGVVRGKVSGTMTITEETNFLGAKTIQLTYDQYSDDGRLYYNGTEYSSGSAITSTVYSALLTVTDKDGNTVGEMDVELHFSAAYKLSSLWGSKSPQLDLTASHGTAVWQGQTRDISSLVR